MAGKPYPAIYEVCLKEAADRLDGPLDKRRVLCIGDGLPTDVRGANAQDLDVLFIASGIHGGETIGLDGLKPEAVDDLLRQEGLTARWALADLVW
jgi:ribonucleotide monophosphatase NagD (HAD superfamily)